MLIEKSQATIISKKQANDYATFVVKEKLEKAPIKAKYLSSGSFGTTVSVTLPDNKQLIVKLLRTKNMLKKEVFDLKLLASSCTSIKFPEVLFEREADENMPLDCYAMEKLKGKNAFSNFCMLFQSKRKREEFADKITMALHEIHSHTNDKFGNTMCPQFDSWLDYYKPFAESVFENAKALFEANKLSKDIFETMEWAWKKFDSIFEEQPKEACLIHGDLNVANIMIDKKYNITGFIDPLNSMYADREYDLFQFDNLTGKRFFLRDTYAQKYGASINFDIKCAFYGLWNEVYCYIKTGTLIPFIMKPLVRNMKDMLVEFY